MIICDKLPQVDLFTIRKKNSSILVIIVPIRFPLVIANWTFLEAQKMGSGVYMQLFAIVFSLPTIFSLIRIAIPFCSIVLIFVLSSHPACLSIDLKWFCDLGQYSFLDQIAPRLY